MCICACAYGGYLEPWALLALSTLFIKTGCLTGLEFEKLGFVFVQGDACFCLPIPENIPYLTFSFSSLTWAVCRTQNQRQLRASF